MRNDFLIVHKSILPENFDQVIEARELIQNSGESVSDACRKVGISRSTFYKYKDYVFTPQKDFGKKAIIAMRLDNYKGVLSNVINYISSCFCNIITINQEMPVNNIAFVTISLDVIDLELEINEFLKAIKSLNGVKSVELIAIE